MADHDDRRGADARFAWISLFFAAWLTGGLALVNWALSQGLTSDFGFSAYHVPAYMGLVALTVFCAAIVIRAIRRGRPWRDAFPPGYGTLGAGLVVLLAFPIVDVAWREGVGIAVGVGTQVENGLAPSRVLLPIGISLVAVGPLRVALRSRDGSSDLRWAAVLSAGFVLAVLGFVGGFQPASNPWLERPSQPLVGDTEVWAMDADGAHQTRVIEADDRSSASSPSWSPDESSFVYTRWRVGPDGGLDPDIWVARADGSGRHLLVGGADWQWLPSWSPDGRWIVYTQEPAGGPERATGPQGPFSGPGLLGVLSGSTSSSRSYAAIWRVRADGTGSPMRLTDGRADDRAAVYSPDGTRLLFDSLRDGNTQIYVMNADGSRPIRLTHDAVEDWGASWSPDGRRIVFMSDWQIYVMNADGSGVTRLTHNASFDREPTWSPDGTRIAFEAQDGGKSVIWSMATDGTGLRNLSRSPGASASLGGSNGAWGRDGRILYTQAEDPPATDQPVARQDLAAAAMLLEAVLVAIVALVVIRIAPPFGAYGVIMGMAALLAATAGEQWRFVPAAVAAGLAVDILVRFAPPRRRANVAGAASAAALVLYAGVTVAATTGLAWSPTLLLGIAFATAALGWGLAAVVGRPDGTTEAGTTA